MDKINPQTDIERLKSWLLCELDSMLNKLENKYLIEYLLDIWSKYDTDLQYPFLLAKIIQNSLMNGRTK